MKQNEYRAWMEGIREEYLIEAADYKPERRAVPIWYTIGITSAVAAIAVCVGLIAYKGRVNITEPNPVGTAIGTTASDSAQSPKGTAATTAAFEVVTGTAVNGQQVTGEDNYFGGKGDIRVLSESGAVSSVSIAKDNLYYYLPNGSNLRIPISSVDAQHSGTLGYETFTPMTDETGNDITRSLVFYDEYGYYTSENGVLLQIKTDGSQEKIADVKTFTFGREEDLSGRAKGVNTAYTIEKVFHVNDHVMFMQYKGVATYETENDLEALIGCFYDMNTKTEKMIYPIENDAAMNTFFNVKSADFSVQKVYGKDAVFFRSGDSKGVIVDTDRNYYPIDLPENRSMNSYAFAKGDNLYYASYDSDWYCLNYMTGEETVVKKLTESDPRISMGVHSVSGERFWFFGTDNKFYTMKYDFSDLRVVTDQFDSSFTTMYAATDDTVFFSPSSRKNGALIPGYYPLITVKMNGSRFIINTFSNSN